MEDVEKIVFLDKLLSQASKRLDFFDNPSEFYLFDDALFFKLGTDSCDVQRVNEKTGATFYLSFSITSNPILEKSRKVKHSIQTIINRWKKSKSAVDADILLQIVLQMEHEVENGWSIGLKFEKSLVPGLILWHAHVPIEQLAIALDLEA